MNFNEFSGDVVQRGKKAEFTEMLKKNKKCSEPAAESCSCSLSPQLHLLRSECSRGSSVHKHFNLFMATRSTRKVTSAPQALQQVVGSGPAGRQLADWNQSSHRWNTAGLARFTC